VSEPRRNVELKATDPDPERSLAVCLELGAEDRGVLVQRDTYFRVPDGRLKVREETPGGAALIQYRRADVAAARESRYRIAPVEDAEALRAALDAALGTLVVVDKERRLLLWEGVRIHLDTVRGLGTFLELEGVAPPGSDLSAERERVARLSDALGLDESRIVSDSYSDRLLEPAEAGSAPPAEPAPAPPAAPRAGAADDAEPAPAPAPPAAPRRGAADDLLAAARAAMERAYAPYSHFRVGVALRAPDGSIHVGANVENAAYPLGNCAEASAIGALVAAGHRAITEAAVIGGGEEPCVPCGGCRQRLRELMPLTATVHLLAEGGAQAAMTLEELLPRSFGPEFLP
jgi:homotetrameric cytidine deaminase